MAIKPPPAVGGHDANGNWNLATVANVAVDVAGHTDGNVVAARRSTPDTFIPRDNAHAIG